MNTNPCPTDEVLKRFTVGNLPDEEIVQIADHVEACRKCNRILADLDSCTDELVSGLKGLSADPRQNSTAIDNGSNPGDVSGGGLHLDAVSTLAHRIAEGEVEIDRFLLKAELGSGAFGHVFRALDRELDREVAIKIHRSGTFTNSEEVQRFFREAKSAAQLQHPSIVALYETGQSADGYCYLVSEYIAGETLEQILRKGPIEFDVTARQVSELAEALHFAHLHGVIHRDVKPSNILVDKDGKPHLMDFGLAKRVAANDTMTHVGQVMGTPAYMSPEQARGESSQVDARSDVYSLGVVMYEMLCGGQPFQGQKRLLLLQVLEDQPRPPSQIREHIPRDLEVICLKAMAKSPRARYQTAAEMSEDLNRYIRGDTILARPAGYGERFRRWCRRYPAAVVAFVALLIASISAIVYLSMLSQYLVEQTAQDSAQMQSEMLDSMNDYYSGIVDEIESNLKEQWLDIDNGDGMEVPSIDHMLPVPATFTIELGKRLETSESGFQVRLYSNYPFPDRQDGGPQDSFGRKAIEELEKNPDDPVVEFTNFNGRPVVRFATARVMTESCIHCHNHHPQTPKDDWKSGDVRGVLEVIRPLEHDQLRTRRGIGSAVTWVVAIGVVLVGFVAAVAVVTARRQNR